MRLMFYKGEGNLFDKAIRLSTRSIYSHVEILMSDILEDNTCYVLGSSPRDGGVRYKKISFHSEHWDIVDVDWWFEGNIEWAFEQVGKRYDWEGILLSQVFSFRRDDKLKWFCSEFAAEMMCIPNSSLYAPGDLYNLVKYFNEMLKLCTEG